MSNATTKRKLMLQTLPRKPKLLSLPPAQTKQVANAKPSVLSKSAAPAAEAENTTKVTASMVLESVHKLGAVSQDDANLVKGLLIEVKKLLLQHLQQQQDMPQKQQHEMPISSGHPEANKPDDALLGASKKDPATKISKQVQIPHPDKILLTIDEVAALVGLSRATIYTHMDKKGFPAGIHIGDGKNVRWSRKEIDAYVDYKIKSKVDGLHPKSTS